MLPITLNVEKLKIALIGNARGAFKRLQKLDAAGTKFVTIFAEDACKELVNQAGDRLISHLPSDDELAQYKIVLIVDLEDKIAFELGDKAREYGALLNIEDRKDYCDFYYSAVVRRGDLLIGINTGGKCPTLTVRIRQMLEKAFSSIWESRLVELGNIRDEWRSKEAISMKETMDRTDKILEEKGWLGDELCPRHRN